MKDYSKELLASIIAESFDFSDENGNVINELNIDFNGVTASVTGCADSVTDSGNITTLYSAEIHECILYHKDGDENKLNHIELGELSELVKLYS